MKHSYIYMLTNQKGNVIYTSVTNNLEKRIAEHKAKLVKGFTKRYNVDKLVHYETFGDIEMAFEREKEIKGWRREKKDALVMKKNPELVDLSDQWSRDPSHTFGMTSGVAS